MRPLERTDAGSGGTRGNAAATGRQLAYCSRLYILLTLLSGVVLDSCAVGISHTPDAVLEQTFREHRKDFSLLAQALLADRRLTLIMPNLIHYSGAGYSFTDVALLDCPGVTVEQLRWYLAQMKTLKVAVITTRVATSEPTIELRVDKGSLWNGDSYKGYIYSPIPLPPVKRDLDGYRISDRDKDRFGNYSVVKPLEGNWYLYLFVNR